MITRDQAISERRFHAGGGAVGTKCEKWRRNGKTQVWKTRPNDFRTPISYGRFVYGQITHRSQDLFRVEGPDGYCDRCRPA